jgi:AAA domain/CHC2 zinc finger
MKISDLKEREFRKYFEVRLADNRLRKSGSGYTALCCFHQEKHPSLSINIEKGVFCCHACKAQGGIIAFEKQFSGCDEGTAIARIAEIVGQPQLNVGQSPEAVYSYTNAFGKELFQVVRYPGKRFTQRRADPKGGWIYKTSDITMTLYHLDEVTRARNVIIVEGEKACDRLRQAVVDTGIKDVAVTTSPRGAGKWQDEFSVYFAGKQLLILPDNDDPGRKHGDAVARSSYRLAQGVKLLNLPGLPEKGDVCDFLEAGHNVEEILALTNRAGWWNPPAKDLSLFITMTEFEANAAPAIEWLVEGVIQRGANGLVIARPKSGKSFAVADLATALASGQRWLDFHVERRARVALVSREDYYGLTQWRLRKIRQNRGLQTLDLDGWLYINAKGVKPKIMLDDPGEVKTLIDDLKSYQSEFLIFDVMRVLHGAEENDNTEMQKIIDVLNTIQDKCGCSICLIHHDNKREDASLTERIRGASAIAGYAEFICGIRVVDQEEHVRQFECELKASIAPDRFYWKINDMADGGIKLERTTWTPPSRHATREGSAAARLMQ